MKFTAIFEEQRYIEVEIDAPDIDAAEKIALDIEHDTDIAPDAGFNSDQDYDCVRIDYIDPKTGKDTEIYLT